MTTKQVQCLLAYLGYDPGGIDGVDGQKTRQAIRNFQGAEGLGVDGVAGEQTAIRLKDAVWQDRFAKDNIVPSSGQPPDLPGWWGKYKWFAPTEFRCPCGQCGGFPAEPEEKLVRLAERVRAAFDAPVLISSGVRCPAHNAAVGGVKNSRHLLGKAMDFRGKNVPGEKLLAYVRTLPIRYAYRIDSSFVHMDVA